MRFCGLQLEDDVPDHIVVCRCRKAMNESGAWEVLLDLINHRLTKRGVLVKQGAMIDASVTPTPRKPKGKTSHTIQPEDQGPIERSLQPGVDQRSQMGQEGRTTPLWLQAPLPR